MSTLPSIHPTDSTPAHSSDAVAPLLNSCRLFFVSSNKNVSSPRIAEAPGDGDTRTKRCGGRPRGRTKTPTACKNVIFTWYPRFPLLAPNCFSAAPCTHGHVAPPKLEDSSHPTREVPFPASGPWFLLRMSVHPPPPRPITKVPEVVADLSSMSPGLPAECLCSVLPLLGCALLQDGCCAPPQTPPHSPPGKGCIPSH